MASEKEKETKAVSIFTGVVIMIIAIPIAIACFIFANKLRTWAEGQHIFTFLLRLAHVALIAVGVTCSGLSVHALIVRIIMARDPENEELQELREQYKDFDIYDWANLFSEELEYQSRPFTKVHAYTYANYESKRIEIECTLSDYDEFTLKEVKRVYKYWSEICPFASKIKYKY